MVIETALEEAFHQDLISEVPKGVRGADAVQDVNGKSGQSWGTILWESKNTQNWSDDWCQKLLDDQRNLKANVSVIVSRVLPTEVRRFGFYRGVWVTDSASFIGLAQALRLGLQELFTTKRMLDGQTDKASALYKYILSPDFRNKINGVMSTFEILNQDLIKERTAIERLWAKREKSLDSMKRLVAAMYGDIQGYAGSELAEPETLALPEALIEDEPQEDSGNDLPF